LITILLIQAGTQYLSNTSYWKTAFAGSSFVESIGSNILLKALGIMPLLAVMLIASKSSEGFYISKGDLSAKAHKIGWLGIREGAISWGKLAVISAVLISLGTVLLTLVTATGFSVPKGITRLPNFLPFILFFALLNSFCEGLVYRNAILGALRNSLSPQMTVLCAALFFGFAHYYGIPGGSLGAIMSGLLGWYMCRSMVETNGLVSAWIIHFLQDTVIFSTVCVLS
ncbi:MAG: CPBP family intramembrane metalloprotease, partial [Clostridia bacterium]|nr:CPBP family intramembrane metalloprotease [Clostridia bacterium]